MSRKARLVNLAMPAVLVLVHVTCSPAAPAPPAAPVFITRDGTESDPQALLDDERAIVNTLLERQCRDSAAIVVLAETDAWHFGEWIFAANSSAWAAPGAARHLTWRNEHGDIAPPVPEVMGRRLLEASASSLPLLPGIRVPCELHRLDRAELEALLAEDEWWKRLRERYQAIGYHRISRVVFDAERRRALVVHGWYGGTGGSVHLVCMERTDSGWSSVGGYLLAAG
jgi:hypothetical protein